MKRSFTRQQAWITLAVGVAVIAYVASQRGHVPARRQPSRLGPAAHLRGPGPMRDYSMRSGLPLGLEASRGLAAAAAIPADMRTPEPLRPWTSDSPRL